jgi:hypothetical protein
LTGPDAAPTVAVSPLKQNVDHRRPIALLGGPSQR